MKEIDYKEKYEQALAKAKELAIDGYLDAVAVDDIFPELKEPYGERIRKRIIQALLGDVLDIEETNEAIDWLKKQGEQKPAEWAKEDIQMYRNILCYLSEPSPLKEVNGKSREQLLDWFKALKYRVQPQPKQEWSEEDEVKINRIVACLENLNVADNDILLKDVDWLKSLKDRVQPKEKWSEEDEEALEVAIIALEDMYSEDSPLDCYAGHHIPFDKAANQLKSLRSQSQWKPSDEQIMVLRWVLNHIPYDSHKEEISGLLEQLKKLIEE